MAATVNPVNDTRTVLTLDAGGTNFVFTAIRGNKEVVKPVTIPSSGDNLDRCIEVIKTGFENSMAQLAEKPSAISFAFPGPADYLQGIIGDLKNIPCFRGGVPLGPILENHFGVPVFINNDGDLYAYGEALSGFLPYVNSLLESSGSDRHYRNLVGVTLGTGFGGGIVRNGELFTGDNAMAGEVWLMHNRYTPSTNAEEGVSIRAVKKVYAEMSGSTGPVPEPKEICAIANGERPGDRGAAREAFSSLGKVLGEALADVITLIDGIVVVGGGVSGAMHLIFPSLMKAFRSSYTNDSGERYPRLVQTVYNFDNESEQAEFLEQKGAIIPVPGTGKKLTYFERPLLCIGTSRIGTNRAVALGAYAFALNALEKKGQL